MTDQATEMIETPRGGKELAALKQVIKELIEPADMHIQVSRDRDGKILKRAFYKKSFFRKVGRHYRLSVICVDKEKEVNEAGDVSYTMIYRATDPEGVMVDGDGSCSFSELNEKWKGAKSTTVHLVKSIAHTRAFNRAVSNARACGMVSAEEMNIKAAVATAKTEGHDRGEPTQEAEATVHDVVGKGEAAPKPEPILWSDDGSKRINPAQIARLWKIWSVTMGKEADHHALFTIIDTMVPNIPHTKSEKGNDMPDLKLINRDQYDAVCNTISPGSNPPREA